MTSRDLSSRLARIDAAITTYPAMPTTRAILRDLYAFIDAAGYPTDDDSRAYADHLWANASFASHPLVTCNLYDSLEELLFLGRDVRRGSRDAVERLELHLDGVTCILRDLEVVHDVAVTPLATYAIRGDDTEGYRVGFDNGDESHTFETLDELFDYLTALRALTRA
jgi:hypothetical protein